MANQTISLASYSAKIIDTSNLSNPILDNFDKRDLLDVLETLLSSWAKRAEKITTLGDCLKCTKIVRNGRYLKGILEKGASGTEQDIEDLDTNTVVHRMTKGQAVLIPYYFLFYVPEDENKAIFLLQRNGNSSPHIFTEYLAKYVRDSFKPYTLEVNYLLQQDAIDAILQSENVREIRLKQYKWSSDDADNILGQTAEPLIVEVSYRSRYNIPLTTKIKNVILGKSKPSSLVEHNLEPDELSVVAKIGKRKQSFTFAEEKDARFRPYRDITAHISKGANNHPTFESVNNAAMDFMKELAESMYEKPNN